MTVLRSADFDAHWQDIGTRAQMGKENCALAINPTDSFEIYVVTSSNLAAGSPVLKHASDGGNTYVGDHHSHGSCHRSEQFSSLAPTALRGRVQFRGQPPLQLAVTVRPAHANS